MRNRYEEVRMYATGRSFSTALPEGFALILGQGVRDWMNTWAHILPAERVRFPKAKMETVLPPEIIRAQMTVVLARMAIKSAGKTLSC